MTEELPDRTKVRKDLLWGMYTDVRAHARHAETLRSNVVNFMIVIASILIAVIANDGRVSSKDLPLSLVIFAAGILGLGFATSYTELHVRNRNRAELIRKALDTEFFAHETTIGSLLDEADKRHERERLYRWSRRLTGSTHRFWFVLPGLIMAAGLLLTILAL
jgi:hypothetical protein